MNQILLRKPVRLMLFLAPFAGGLLFLLAKSIFFEEPCDTAAILARLKESGEVSLEYSEFKAMNPRPWTARFRKGSFSVEIASSTACRSMTSLEREVRAIYPLERK